jgi:Domain of unknown function (DUF6285)
LTVQDDPSGAALLDIAHSTLMGEIAPALKGRERYLALMIGNAMRIVGREIDADTRAKQARTRVADVVAQRAAPAAGNAGMAQAIRAGQLDADAALYTALREAAIVAVATSKPAFLSSTERDVIGVAIGSKPAVLDRTT